jgi:2-polyprenyl-3-methyl-5-hydroxy-6-metoxy-1,4-benzoquinol methylase
MMPATWLCDRSKLFPMNGPPDARELKILRSWHANAKPWSAAVRSQSIASRKLVTDRAVIDAVQSVRPRRVFDVGCGEGWLARALQGAGAEVFGVDGVAALIEEAVRLGCASFAVQSFESIARHECERGRFDAVVCNFSLLGHESVESLLGSLGAYLEDPGYLVVQTLHPLAACGEAPYRDGWREGSWRGFGEEFSDPAPWYFRTLESWVALLARCGFDILECREPTACDAHAPASVIFIGKARRAAQTRTMEQR